MTAISTRPGRGPGVGPLRPAMVASRRADPSRHRVVVGLLIAIAVCCGVVVVAQRERGLDAIANRLSPGSAWLLARNGNVALIDGLTGREITRRPATLGADQVAHIVQDGPDGFVVNRTAGTVMRLDGVMLQSGPPVLFSPGGDDPLLDVFLTEDGRAWVMSGTTATLYPVDPATLVASGPPQALDAGATSTAVDPRGVLFVLNAAARVLDRHRPDEPVERTLLDGLGPDAELTVVGDDAVLVDPARDTLNVVRASGEPGAPRCFALPDGPSQLSSANSGSSWLSAIGADQRLYAADLRRDGCPPPILLDGSAGSAGTGQYGRPVEQGGRIYLPDHSTGEVVVVDVQAARPTVRRTGTVIAPGSKFDLFVDDGMLWIDDRVGDAAGVLLADGTVRTIQKYDPSGSGAGAAPGAVPDAVAPEDVPPGGGIGATSEAVDAPAGTGANADEPAATDGPDAAGSPAEVAGGQAPLPTLPDDTGPQPSQLDEPRPPQPTLPNPSPTRPPNPEVPIDRPAPPPAPGPTPSTGTTGGPDRNPPVTQPGPLTAAFDIVGTVVATRPATFASSSSGSITGYTWSVDGAEQDETTGLFRHTFAKAGTAVVSLTVRGEEGVTPKTATKTVRIEPLDQVVRVTVPNVVGSIRSGAVSTLDAAGLSLGGVTTRDSTRPKDEVLEQRPAAGAKADTGTTVDVVVSAGPTVTPPVAVPEVRGTLCDEGRKMLTDAGLVVPEPTVFPLKPPASNFPDDVAAIISVSTHVPAGQTVERGTTVPLDCKKAPPVPSLVGLLEVDARATVQQRLGAVAVTTTVVTDESHLKGEVVSQTPQPGTPADIDTIGIALTVASGPIADPDPEVPCTATRAEAEAALPGAGLQVGTVTLQASTTVPRDALISTNPPCGTRVPRGTSVDLTVSSGPPPVVQPCQAGMTRDDCTNRIAAAGLSAVVSEVQSTTVAAGIVISTNPTGGTQVGAGSTVDVSVAATKPEPKVLVTCSSTSTDTLPCTATVQNGTATQFTWSVVLDVHQPAPGTRTASHTGGATVSVRAYAKLDESFTKVIEELPDAFTVTVIAIVDQVEVRGSAPVSWSHCH